MQRECGCEVVRYSVFLTSCLVPRSSFATALDDAPMPSPHPNDHPDHHPDRRASPPRGGPHHETGDGDVELERDEGEGGRYRCMSMAGRVVRWIMCGAEERSGLMSMSRTTRCRSLRGKLNYHTALSSRRPAGGAWTRSGCLLRVSIPAKQHICHSV
ncbi:hypothetical protein B0H12DRAFT_105899 [Mycena haematopus]|nr:hypothetical protein B0H12DRAFT_105899 [Mycena haematopus]